MDINKEKEHWQKEIINCVRDLNELLEIVKITPQQIHLPKTLLNFPLQVPHSFINRIEKNNPLDPLLIQILPTQMENNSLPNYFTDPLQEKNKTPHPGLIHKYSGRALIKLTNHCAINCRYCFRRHSLNEKSNLNSKNWNTIINYLNLNKDITEIILSGGDPLILKDNTLQTIFTNLRKIPHIQRIRIHSRIPIILPDRITTKFIQTMHNSDFKIILVTHCNHPNEIDNHVKERLNLLAKSEITLLNQSVLLKNVNDNGATLVKLSEKLFNTGIMPYYLHLLDPVLGASHYFVKYSVAQQLMWYMLKKLPGYLVPRLVKEIPNAPTKVPIYLPQSKLTAEQ